MSGFNLPEGLTSRDLCHIEGHDYGAVGKPVSTCRGCGCQNYALRAYIGAVTRKAEAWGVSWTAADERWTRQLEERDERQAA